MANLSKERRDRMIAKLEELKLLHNDDASIASLNEIENALREKKYGLVWEEHSEAVDDMLKDNIPVLVADPERRLCKDENLPWNFIIEGDNLQALYLLERTHRGKVDCIYIDPPYNTGARDWKYNNDYVDGNDQYRHSKWLSMMKSRLIVAKRLLNPHNSVLIVTIDEKEYLHLGCLLEELFSEAKIQMISTMIKPGGVARDNQFFRTDEYIFIVEIGIAAPIPLPLSDEWTARADKRTVHLSWRQFSRSGSNSLRTHSPGCFYPIFVAKDGSRIVKVGEPLPKGANRTDITAPEGTIPIWPIHIDGNEGCWMQTPQNLRKLIELGYVRLGRFSNNGMAISYLNRKEIEKINSGGMTIEGRRSDNSIIVDDSQFQRRSIPGTQWSIYNHNALIGGTNLLSGIFNGKRFDFPKSLYAEHDVIRFFVDDKPNATVVDFFAGSGTTMHAVNLLNAEDGGQRRCIMVTNNEVSDAEAKAMTERGLHPGDDEWEKNGIARYVTWPRTVCSIEGHDVNGNALKGNYLGTNLPMADGFQANVKYFKCGWTPRKPDDYLLSNALCLHVKELIELQTAQEVDGIKNVVILSKMDYKMVFEDPAKAAIVERVWANENLVFSAAEMRILREKKFRYIPREFFSQELKEVGEYV